MRMFEAFLDKPKRQGMAWAFFIRVFENYIPPSAFTAA